MTELIDVISLGAGVQSSTLLMMADRGEIKINGEVIIPKYAIMSDPGNEPEKVYKWIQFLQSQVKNIEIVLTKNGDIIEDTLDGIKNNRRFASVPFFTKRVVPVFEKVLVSEEEIILGDYDDWNDDYVDDDADVFVSYKDGKKLVATNQPTYKKGRQLGFKTEKGILWRQCTGEYKINAVRKKLRELYGYGSRDKVKEKFRLWMGISTDEIQRVKPSGVKYIENVFPLIDYEMSRQDCLDWFSKNNLPLPPRSSCIICPYHSNTHWRDMKENDPISWYMAVDFDRKIRKWPKLEAEVFLHRSCVPLDQVDFGTEQLGFEVDAFNNECEGMCGV